MTNPYYNHVSGNPPSQVRGTSPMIRTEFDAVAAGFDGINTSLAGSQTEITAAREGQADLLTNLLRYVGVAHGMPGNIAANGYRTTGAGNAVSAQDYTTLSQVQAMAFSSALPAVAGQFGRVIRVNAGPAAAWDNWWGAPTVLTAANNGATLAVNTTYHINSSGGAFSLSMPVMATNDWIKLIDVAGQLGTNNVTITRNATNGNLAGYAEDRILDVAWDSLEMVKTASNGVIEQ